MTDLDKSIGEIFKEIEELRAENERMKPVFLLVERMERAWGGKYDVLAPGIQAIIDAYRKAKEEENEGIHTTWEVYKAVSENPKLQFKRLSDSTIHHVSQSGKWLESIGGGGFAIHQINEKWPLFQEPVIWQEAIQAWADGKKVKYSCKGCVSGQTCDSKAEKFLLPGMASVICPSLIVNGTFFVEDGSID